MRHSRVLFSERNTQTGIRHSWRVKGKNGEVIANSISGMELEKVEQCYENLKLIFEELKKHFGVAEGDSRIIFKTRKTQRGKKHVWKVYNEAGHLLGMSTPKQQFFNKKDCEHNLKIFFEALTEHYTRTGEVK